MPRFDFTNQAHNAIAKQRFYHRNPRVQRPMEILWLKQHEETHERIEQLTGVRRQPTQVRMFLRDTATFLKDGA